MCAAYTTLAQDGLLMLTLPLALALVMMCAAYTTLAQDGLLNDVFGMQAQDEAAELLTDVPEVAIARMDLSRLRGLCLGLRIGFGSGLRVRVGVGNSI